MNTYINNNNKKQKKIMTRTELLEWIRLLDSSVSPPTHSVFLSGFFFSPYIFENNGYGMIGKPHVIFTICIQPLRLASRPIIGQEIEFFKK